MSISKFFGWKFGHSSPGELPDIFPLGIDKGIFVQTDVEFIYARILTDVLERTQGVPSEFEYLMWDNCVANESPDGLVTLLSKAMTNRRELFVVFDPGLPIIRKATYQEEQQIRADYAKQNKSSIGVYISFKNFKQADMVRLYSALEYCTVGGLNKLMNLSNTVQVKVSDLRASVSALDSPEASVQGLNLATALSRGQNIMLDAKDEIVTATPNVESTKSSMEFINQKRSFYLGMPATYITGESSKGLGDTGQGDAKAIERGLKNYYFSVIKPVIEAIFQGAKTSFKSDDFQQISSSLETLKTFELTSDEYLSKENKQIIVNKMFGLPEDEVGDEPEPAPAPLAIAAPPKAVTGV